MRAQEARKIPLPQLLSAVRHEPVKEVHDELWYLSPFRHETEPSFKTDKTKLLWYDHGMGKGGNIIDLGFLLFDTSSVSVVLGELDRVLGTPARNSTSEKKKQPSDKHGADEPAFTDVSVKQLHHPALLRYLRERGINPIVARPYVQEVHYSLADKRYFAIAFPNDVGGYELRNAHFKGGMGAKGISRVKTKTHLPARTVKVFEGFIDFLSYVAFYKGTLPDEPVIVLNGVGRGEHAMRAIGQMDVQSVQLYLDNDAAGRELVQTFCQTLANHQIIDQSRHYAGFKDVNAWLVGNQQESGVSQIVSGR